MRRKFQKGFIDPISLIGIGFLVFTLFVGSVYVNKKGTNLDIREKAVACNPEGEYCGGTTTCCNNLVCSGSICKTKAKTPTPDPTPAPTSTSPPNACIVNGKCLGPGEDCCGNEYFDNTCNVTETRCGIKPKTPTPTPSPTPTDKPSCGGNLEPCCKQGYPNGTCDSGLYCSNIDDGTCMTAICHAERKCSGNILQICKIDDSGWNNTTCQYGCNATTKDCNVCQPGDKVCESDSLKTCNTTGTAWTTQVCGTNKTCDANLKICVSKTGTCLEPCEQNSDCGENNYCYKPSGGCPVCKTMGTFCAPGTKQCFGDYIQTCNSTGTSWISQGCNGAGCDSITKECKPDTTLISQKDCDECLKTNSPSECQGACANVGKKIVDYSCTPGTKECFFGNLKTCSSSGTWGMTTCSVGCNEETDECIIENKDWHYKCSIAGDWSIYVHNKTLAVDWGKSQRCSGGCVNGSCKNIDNSTCQENVVSLDGFEKCENGVWVCIPNQTRRITLPGQSNLGEIFVCNQDQSITSSLVNSSFSCDDNNNLIEDNNGIKTTYPCKDDVCLNPKDYKFVTQAGCYGQEYINANICNDGAIIEPTSQGQCKQMCEKGAYVYTNPLDCIRDPKAVFERTCTNDVKPKVLENNKIVERCSGGCSYGQCIPAPNSVCNLGDGYLVGSSDPCLVVCVNGRYQNTQICSSLIKTEGYWNNDDLLTLLKSINEFPERYRKTTNDILFERINQPYTRCMENCSSLASGGYSNRNVFSWLKIPGSIEIPDTGTDALTFEHEIIHAIDDMNSEIAREYAKATGCKQNPSDPNGNYIFTEDPYREYGTTNCAEGLAVTCGEEYMDYILSCNMKVNRPNSYIFCKNEVFGGKEYCDESSKSKRGNTLDKLIKLTKGLFTIVYAMDTTPSAMETKLEILIPGTTKASDIDSILDAHLEKITTNNKTIFTFESSDSSRTHLVYVENGIVIFAQIVFDKTNTHDLTNITKQLGAAEIKSFSTHGLNTPVYSYPSRGLSFFVEGDTNQIFMVQKYPPTNQEEFKNTIGANFTDEQYGDTFENISLIKEQIITNQISQRSDSYLDSDNVLVISILVSILTIAIIIFIKLKKNSPSNKTV